MDDSGTRQKDRTFQVLSAVLIKEDFINIEALMGNSLEELIPEDRLENFDEFHASELFNGYGIFDGIDQAKRMKAIEFLLKLVPDYKLPVIYGAVNEPLLRNKPYASANPLDIGFRICAEGIEEWMGKNATDDMVIFIVDECGKDKSVLKASFRELRKHIRPPHWVVGKLWHVHDDMYFGDSKDSIGIQLADLCSYFIGKHLEKDAAAEGFYQIIDDQIVFRKVEPE